MDRLVVRGTKRLYVKQTPVRAFKVPLLGGWAFGCCPPCLEAGVLMLLHHFY